MYLCSQKLSGMEDKEIDKSIETNLELAQMLEWADKDI